MGGCGHLSTCGYPPLWQRATLIGEKTNRAEKRAGSALWGNQGKAHSKEQKDSAHRPPGCPFLSSDLESIPLTPLNLILSILDGKPYRPWWLHSDPLTIRESPSFLSHFIGPNLYVDFSISMLLRIIVTSPYNCHSDGKTVMAFSKQDRVTAGRYTVALHQVTSHVLVILLPSTNALFPCSLAWSHLFSLSKSR